MSEILYQISPRKGHYTDPNKIKKYYTLQINQYGILGLLFIQTISYPIERAQILFQTRRYPIFTCPEGESIRYETIENYFLQEGKIRNSVKQLYTGFSAKLLKFFTREFTFFTLCDYFNQKIRKHDPSEKPIRYAFRNLVAIFMSTIIVETFAYPFECAKTRMICDLDFTNTRRFPTIRKALGYSENNSHFFKGLGFSMMGAFVYRGLTVGTYDLALSLGMNQWYLLAPMSFVVTFFTQMLTYPIDTLRRYLMLSGTPFQVEHGKGFEIARRLCHLESGRLLYAMEYNLFRSCISGTFLFLYKGVEQNLVREKDIYGGVYN